MTGKARQELIDNEPASPSNTETPITPQDVRFRFYASQQFAVIEMLNIINDSTFPNDVRETIKEKLLKAMSGIAQLHTDLPFEHQAEIQFLMEIINSDIVFIGAGQQERKEQIMNLLNLE